MNMNFKLEICSDLNYEGVVVDVSCKRDLVATLNQDKGIDNIEIRIYSPTNEKFWSFSLDEFLHALQKAKELLIKCNQKKGD